MDIRTNIRAIVVGLVGVSLVVLVLVLFAKGMGGGSSTPNNLIDLGGYATTPATASVLVDGPTNADQDHRQVRITVSQTQTQIEVMQGYQGSVVDTRSFANNAESYKTFLQSLKQVNFARGTDAKLSENYKGYCPTGERYVFTFNDGDTDKFQYWSTSCGQGTYRGNRRATLNLFRKQIPTKDYQQVTNKLSFGL